MKCFEKGVGTKGIREPSRNQRTIRKGRQSVRGGGDHPDSAGGGGTARHRGLVVTHRQN